MPFSDLQNFMLTVGEEGRPLNGIGALGRPVKHNFTAAVSDRELPPCKLVSISDSESQAYGPYLCARQED